MSSDIVPAGETRVVLVGSGKVNQTRNVSLCIVATQEESLDDGWSQSGLGTLEIGHGAPVRVEFDIKEEALLNVPATRFQLSVTNLNGPGDPDLHVRAFFVQGLTKGRNTRSYDLSHGMENPNIRVPPFADSFIFNLVGPHAGFVALLSDSQPGETYGETQPDVLHHLGQRDRWVRFMGLPTSVMGTLTFFISI